MTGPGRLSRRAESIPPSAIRRFFDLANEMKGSVISLSIGEPDFVTPVGIRDAGLRSLEAGRTHYSPNPGFYELRESIAGYLRRRFELDYQPRGEIVVTVGGSEAIDICARAVLNPGDEVVIPEPCFVAYQAAVLLAGGVPVPVVCSADDGFRLRADRLEEAITARTKLVLLGFPNNPTGAVMSRAELSEIAAVIRQHDVLVLSDELYAELTYEPAEPCSFAALPGMWERTVLVGGFSKAFAMTGWRLGFAAGPSDILGAMNKIHQYTIMSSPTTAQDAAIEALANSEQYIKPMRDDYNRRRRLVIQGCRDAGLTCTEPLGAFYVFPDIRASGLSSNDFCERFLREEKVAIVPGHAFGASGEGYVRISYAASLDNLREALKRLAAFMERCRN